MKLWFLLEAVMEKLYDAYPWKIINFSYLLFLLISEREMKVDSVKVLSEHTRECVDSVTPDDGNS